MNPSPPTYGTGKHIYECTVCGTIIRSVLPYTTSPEPWHRHDMVFVKDPLYGPLPPRGIGGDRTARGECGIAPHVAKPSAV